MQPGILSFIGGGDVYMDRLTAAGVSTGFKKVGNATKFELKVDTEVKKLRATGRDNYGQTLASVTRITDSTIGITLNQLDNEMLASVFLGESVARTGAGGTVTSEAIVASHDKFVELAHGDISAVSVTVQSASIITGSDSTLAAASNWTNVDIGSYDESGDLTLTASAGDQYCTLPVANATTTIGKNYKLSFSVANIVETWTVKDFTGATTLGTVSANGAKEITFTAATTGGFRIVANAATSSGDFDKFTLYQVYTVDTDYTVNTNIGMVKALSTGSIVDGATVYVTYTWAAETGYRITGATQPVVKVGLRLDGKNDYDGEPVIVKVWEANVRPSSAVDFLSPDFLEIQIEGDMVTPSSKSWPFEVI